MKHLFAGLLLMAHMAAGQTLDSTRLDSLPGKSNFRLGFLYEFGENTSATLLPAMRSFFRANQLKPLEIGSGTINLSFGIRLNRVKIMVQSQSSFFRSSTTPNFFRLSQPVTNNNWVQKSGINSQGILIGYDVLNSFNKRVFIFLGVGGAEYNLSLYRKGTQTIPFQSVLTASPPTSVPSLALRNVGYFEVAVEISQREKRKVSPYTATRIGYRTGTFKKAWESDVYTFTDPIKDRFSQFYFQLIFAYSINANRFVPFSRKPFR